MAETTASPNNVKVAFKGKPMAKSSKSGSAIAEAAPAKPKDDWDAQDALRTMQRAEEHQSDKDLMKRVGAHVTKQADSLAKVQAKLESRGLISPKQAQKIAKRRVAAATK
jgi:hypothetical protein